MKFYLKLLTQVERGEFLSDICSERWIVMPNDVSKPAVRPRRLPRGPRSPMTDAVPVVVPEAAQLREWAPMENETAFGSAVRRHKDRLLP